MTTDNSQHDDLSRERLLREALAVLRERREGDQDMVPKRDLWSGIEHGINVPPRSHSKAVVFAASLLLMLGLGSYLFRQPLTGPALSTEMLPVLSQLQNDHQQNKQALLVTYQDQQSFYPEWEQQMQQLEEAENVIYSALQKDPANIELMKILHQVQSRQLELIEQVFTPYLRNI